MKKRILMCCSDRSVKGGMVTVLNNFLSYENWNDFDIIYVPTHIEKTKVELIIFFLKAYIKILFMSIFGKYDLAYLHMAERGSVYRKGIIERTAKLFRKKVIIHHHSAEFDLFYNSISGSKKKFVDKTLEIADLNIVLSENLVSMITNKVPNAKVDVLYNSVRTYEKKPYNPKGTGILFLGRLGERKGTFDLLLAIKQIDEQIDEKYRFYLCGDGDIEGVKEKIKELKIEKRIAHVGWIEKKDKKRIYSNIIINVLPSYNEGLPMSILETMAYGIPSISTNIASIPEVVHDGENGYIIEPGDINSLAEKILQLINDSQKRVNYSDNSWKLISTEFSFNVQMEKLKKILNRVLKEK